MRLAEVLREQGRIKSWFADRMGWSAPRAFYWLESPSAWTQAERELASEILDVPVEELFPIEEEGDITWLEYGLRLSGLPRCRLAELLGVSASLMYKMLCDRRSWRGREQRVGQILGIDPARMWEKVSETGRQGDKGTGRGGDGR